MSRAMKPSGIEWIGEIPEGWSIKPLFVLFKERKHKNKNNIEVNLLSLSYGRIIRKNASTNMGLLPVSFEGYNIVEKDDVVFRLTDLQNDHVSLRSGLVKERGMITSAYITITSNFKIDSSYYHYVFRGYDVCKVFYNMGGGVRQSLNYSEFKKLLLLFPPLPEQQAIADYLDEKCVLIDSTIEKQKTAIEKLKLYKQSVITEAVTKGLDPTVPMKPSGIEWIGDIPEHWKVKKLKTHVELISKKQDNHSQKYIGLENIESWTGKYVRTEQDRNEGASSMFNSGDVLFGKLRPYLAKCYIPDFDGVCSSEFLVLRCIVISNVFLHYVLLSHWFINIVDSSTYGTKMPRASWNFIGEMQISTPPLPEQQAIADYLDQKCAQIDQTIELKQKLIEKLSDYKKSLIYECVTGKREVKTA